MSGGHSIDEEREQIAALLRKIIVDDEFRNSFRADPRTAIAASGVPLSAEAADKIVRSQELAPSVMAHMEGTEEVSKFFFFALAFDQ